MTKVLIILYFKNFAINRLVIKLESKIFKYSDYRTQGIIETDSLFENQLVRENVEEKSMYMLHVKTTNRIPYIIFNTKIHIKIFM